jgi:5-methylcytosine-specific restriction endonuclease McrA
MKAPPLTETERRAIMARDGMRCRYCGAALRKFREAWQFNHDGTRPAHVDHVVPRARGGQNDPSNLLLSCETCNEQKGAD